MPKNISYFLVNFYSRRLYFAFLAFLVACYLLVIGQSSSAWASDTEVLCDSHEVAGFNPYEPLPVVYCHTPDSNGGSKRPLAVVFHALGGAKDDPQNSRLLHQLVSLGYDTVAFDAFMHGERQIVVKKLGSSQSLDPEYYLWRHQLGVTQSALDASSLIENADFLKHSNLNRIVAIGTSMGGSSAVLWACNEPRVTKVVNIIGAVDFAHDISKLPKGTKRDDFLKSLSAVLTTRLRLSNPAQGCPRFPRESLFLHGDKDSKVDIQTIRKFAALLKSKSDIEITRKEFVGQGHQVTQTMIDQALTWLSYDR